MRRKWFVPGSTALLVGTMAWAIHTYWLHRFELPYVDIPAVGAESSVYMANGIKTGEVSSHSAIVWTRLTRNPKTDPETKWGRLVTGTPGEVRISYWPGENKSQRAETSWVAVKPREDFTRQLKLANLRPATDYSVLVEGRPLDDQENISHLEGRFRTAPDQHVPAPIHFSVITCQEYHRRDDAENGHKIYRSMHEMDLDFLVHTGDNVYYDQPNPYATTIALAQFKWNRMYAMPFQRLFFNNTSSYFMKDDHDTLKNDSFPGETFGDITWQQGLDLFREQVPVGDKTYRTFRWGSDLQIWLVEGRDFRSANDLPDGPDKTIWGATQKKWFFDSVRNSDATFRILISPTPIIGPDHKTKNDNHATPAFRTEGEEIRAFVGNQENMFIVAGDRHWQYISKDPESGAMEFGSGPASDELTEELKKKDRSAMLKYLKIAGGFLTVAVLRRDDTPHIIFRHHAVDGSINNEEIFRL